jgi:hypothetical protein
MLYAVMFRRRMRTGQKAAPLRDLAVAFLGILFAAAMSSISVPSGASVHHEAGTPVVRVCKGSWMYSHHRVVATVVSRGPALVKITAGDSAGRSKSGVTTIPIGKTSTSLSISLPKVPTLVLATVVEHNANGSLRGIDETCDLSRAHH